MYMLIRKYHQKL